MGRAFAVALAREGCALLLCDVLEDLPDGTPYPKATQADMNQTLAAVEEHGGRCVALKADMRDAGQAASVIDRAMEEFGRLDFLVANHAVTIESPLVDMPPEVFDTVVQSNLNGVFYVLSPALKVMTEQQRGRVVIISSGSGRHREEKACAYVASKSGLVGLAKTAALEVAKAA
jgi:NAD(P)-dependent dehydrogenase (short-subunit alcohol dehydrogenase family)